MTGCDLALLDVSLPDGRRADIGFENGRVMHIGAVDTADEIVRCHGLLLIPAATDMHVHMRGGCQSEKEDWCSGTMSALAGGVTLVVDQPNTVPALTTPTLLTRRVEEALAGALCGFAINAGVVPGADLASLWDAGAMAFGEIFAGPSSYGEALEVQELSEALRSIHHMGSLATIHAEEVGTSRPETLSGHDDNRSPGGEAGAVRKVFQLNKTGCRLHFCHMSTPQAIGVIIDHRCEEHGRVPDTDEVAVNARTSFEVAPHHLLLSKEDFPPDDTSAKVNPPLRDKKIQSGMWKFWDCIDVVASDHAPHTAVEKTVKFPDAPSGIPGVGTMVPLLLAELQRRKLPLSSLVEKVSRRPCEILGIPPAGFQPGDRADFALYPEEITRVNPENLYSRAGWTPFEGMPAIFPILVVMEGKIVYRNGEFFNTIPRWYPGKGHTIRWHNGI